VSALVEPVRGDRLTAAQMTELIRYTKSSRLVGTVGGGTIQQGPYGTIINNLDEEEIGSARPVFSSAETLAAVVGEPVSFQLAAAPFAYIFGAAERAPLPPGLSLDEDTGLITGAVTEPGEWATIVWARNTRGARSQALVITATMPALPIADDQSAEGQVGEVFSYQIELDGGGTPRTFAGIDAYAVSGLPAGLTLDATTGLISGTPTTTLDSVALTMTISNASGAAWHELHARKPLLTLLIRPPAAPRITSATDAGAFVDSQFDYYFTTNVDAFLWEVDAGTPLPPGLEIDFSATPWLPPPASFEPMYARITGIPTQAGVWQVLVRAGGQAGWGPLFTLTISVGTVVPQVLAGSPPEWDLASGSLVLDIELTASNGPLVAWAERNNTSPLHIEDEPPDTQTRYLRGTITAAGIYTIEVRAANQFGWGDWLLIEVVAFDSRAPVITHDGTESGEALTTKEIAIVASNTPTAYGCTLVSGSAICSATGSTAKVTARTDGEHTVRLSATNAYGTAYKDVVLTATDATYTVPYADTALDLACGVDINEAEEIIITGIGPIEETKGSGMPSGLALEADGAIDGTHSYNPSQTYPKTFNVSVSVKIAGEWFAVGTSKIRMVANTTITVTPPNGTSGTVSAADYVRGSWYYPADWLWNTGDPTLSHGTPASSTWAAAKVSGTGKSALNGLSSIGKLTISGGFTAVGYTTQTDVWRLSMTNAFGSGHVDITITSRP
jgi:hypothetical protein